MRARPGDRPHRGPPPDRDAPGLKPFNDEDTWISNSKASPPSSPAAAWASARRHRREPGARRHVDVAIVARSVALLEQAATEMHRALAERARAGRAAGDGGHHRHAIGQRRDGEDRRGLWPHRHPGQRRRPSGRPGAQRARARPTPTGPAGGHRHQGGGLPPLRQGGGAAHAQANRYGRIINIGGLTGRGSKQLSGMRNVAICHMTKTLSDQLGPDGITVNTIHPGVVETPHIHELYEKEAKKQGLSGGRSRGQLREGHADPPRAAARGDGLDHRLPRLAQVRLDHRRVAGLRRRHHARHLHLTPTHRNCNMNGTILVGTAGQGILRSNDDGRTWHRLGLKEAIEFDGVVRALAVDPARPAAHLRRRRCRPVHQHRWRRALHAGSIRRCHRRPDGVVHRRRSGQPAGAVRGHRCAVACGAVQVGGFRRELAASAARVPRVLPGREPPAPADHRGGPAGCERRVVRRGGRRRLAQPRRRAPLGAAGQPGQAIRSSDIHAISILPATASAPRTFIVLSVNAVHVSQDDGQTWDWQLSKQRFDGLYYTRTVLPLAGSRTTNCCWPSATARRARAARIYRSADRGYQWSATTLETAPNSTVLGLRRP